MIGLAWSVLVIGLAGTAAFAIVLGGDQRRERRQSFDAAVERATDRIRAEIRRHEETLHAGAALLAANPDLSAAAFTRFGRDLEANGRLPGTDGLAWIERVGRDETSAYVARQHREGRPRFSLRAPAVAPRGARGDRFVTTYIGPRPSWSSSGFDVGAVVRLRPALLRARDRGRSVMSGRYTPFGDEGAAAQEDGFVLFMPVYNPRRADSVAARRSALRGWMALRFQGEQFVTSVLAGDRVPIRWRVFDGPDPERATQLAADMKAGEAVDGLSSTTAVSVAGRRWSMQAEALQPFTSATDRAIIPATVFLGALLSFLLAGAVHRLARSRAEARDLSTMLRAEERHFRTLAASSPVGIFNLDPGGKTLYANARFREILELREHDDLSLAWEQRVDPDDLPSIATMWRATPHEADERSVRLRVGLDDGSTRWVQVRAAQVRDDRGELEGFVGSVEDVTDRELFERQLSHQALHDPLTGLPNRTLFRDRVAHSVSASRRGAHRVVVMFLDLDRFKLVNDSFGHGAGDGMLVAVSERIDAVLRPGDTVARLGGDEFAVLCEVGDRREAMKIAKRIRDSFAQPLHLQVGDVATSASIGVAFSEDGSDEPDDLLRDADAAMYRAKDRGGARVELFDHTMRAHALERLHMETDLRRAIRRRELEVHYQPEVRLTDGVMVGLEALVRWNHPIQGLLEPASFIPHAEDSGLITEIGRWVLEESCRQLAEWRRDRLVGSEVTLAVNLSARQLADAGLIATVQGALDAAGLPAERLRLEITESMLMEGTQMREALHAIKSLGVGLSLDDFGTGHSSLSYLRHFPVDAVKIDRSFIGGMVDGTSDRAIVVAVRDVAESLGLTTVAEGIETHEQLMLLTQLGCESGQGFLFARPLTSQQLAELASCRDWRNEPIRTI